MKRIYKYSKKGKQRNNQKTKIKKIYEMQNLINPKSIDQTNKSNSGFSGHCMNQRNKVNIKRQKISMECKNQKLFEGSEPTKHIKVKKIQKNRSFLWIAETKKL